MSAARFRLLELARREHNEDAGRLWVCVVALVMEGEVGSVLLMGQPATGVVFPACEVRIGECPDDVLGRLLAELRLTGDVTPVCLVQESGIGVRLVYRVVVRGVPTGISGILGGRWVPVTGVHGVKSVVPDVLWLAPLVAYWTGSAVVSR